MQPFDSLAEIARARVEDVGRGPGVVLGVISAEGRAVAAAGLCEAGGDRPVQRDTLFEIGSITKVFTALLLADAVLRGELPLDDPIDRWLPAGACVPAFDGQPMRLVDLATHGTGMPSFMENAPAFDGDFARYDRAALLADVAAHALTRPIGAAWKYSNTGYGLLGIALETATGAAYEALIAERILKPLGMTSTAFHLTTALQARAATPHGSDAATPVGCVALPSMLSAGGLWSSADDLLTFLAAAVGLTETPLAPAFAAMLATRRPGPSPAPPGVTIEQALGWLVIGTSKAAPLIAHTGGTVGMASAAVADPAARTAAVMLVNSTLGGMDTAINLLRPSHKVAEGPPAERRTAIDADPEILARLPGRYAFEGGVEVLVEVDGLGLVIRPPDAPRMRMLACATGGFFNPSYGLPLSFDLAAPGPAAALTLSTGGPDQIARRIA